MKCTLHTLVFPERFSKAALQYLGPVPKVAVIPFPVGVQVITDTKGTGMQQAVDSLRAYIAQYADPACFLSFSQPGTLTTPE